MNSITPFDLRHAVLASRSTVHEYVAQNWPALRNAAALLGGQRGAREASRLKSERLRREIKMIGEQAVNGFVDRVIVLTQRDINPIDLHNAKLLHEVRHGDPEADQAAEAATSSLIGSATVADLTAAIAMGSRGFRALARLIRMKILVLQHHEVVSYDSLVRRAF